MTTSLSDSAGNGRTSHARRHDSAGLGELLRRAREDRGLTLEQVSNETKIPRRHLEALEHDNLAAGPAGFYRRAEIRAYARVVNLDQNLALAELDRALNLPAARESVSETRQEPPPSHKRVLVVIGVVVVAAVLGFTIGGREPALDGDGQVSSATGSPQQSAPSVGEPPPDVVVGTSRFTQLDQVALPSAPPERALAVAMEPTGARVSAASNGDGVVTTEQAEVRASTDSITELVVTTQPAGARVTVNQIGWGIAPVTIRYLPAGEKRIRVSKDGYATEERVVRVDEGERKMLDIQLRSAP